MKRNFAFILILVILAMVFTPCVYAEDAENVEDVENVEVPKDPEPSEIVLGILSWDTSNVSEPKVEYTFDSVRTSGVTLTTYFDILTQTIGIQIVPDLDIGICIYDDPATEEIDGIRVNGQTVSSLKVPLGAAPVDVTVAVRLDYKSGVAGSIARILDGTYDWTELLSNPMVVFGCLYYILLTIFMVISSIAALRAKRKKVQSDIDIAALVDQKVTNGIAALQKFSISSLTDQIAPMLKTSNDSTQRILKAFLVSLPNMKNPAAVLDILQESCGVNVDALIEQAQKSVLETGEKVLEHREKVVNLLDALQASDKDREVLKNEAVQSTASPAIGAETKSVF